MYSLKWELMVLFSISWVQKASSFVIQQQQQATHFGNSDDQSTIIISRSTIICPQTTSLSLSATVNGDGKNAGTTAVPSKPGFPLHSLFTAAAKAAVPKAPDTETGAHDAVSETLLFCRQCQHYLSELLNYAHALSVFFVLERVVPL